jgi:hypothetical protein
LVYMPLAQRVNDDLFLRFFRWATAFEKRLS